MEFQGCPICFDDAYIEPYYLNCGHLYCKDCLNSYITSRVINGQVKEIPCPNVSCGTNLSNDTIQVLIDNKNYQKYNNFKAKKIAYDNPKSRWCPKPDCESVVIGDESHSDFPKLTCPLCSTEFCYKCRELWHPKKSCEKNAKKLRKKDKNRKKNNKWLNKHKTKPCPKCEVNVERDGGCYHMTCHNCSHEFCWHCLEDYVHGHYKNGKCAGKQFYKHRWQKWLRYIGVGFLIVGGVILLCIIGPPILIGWGIYKLCKHCPCCCCK